MRRLMLLRHAKSDRPAGIADHERPLAKSGEEACFTIGAYLAREHLIPDLALVSSATRTRETWRLVANFLPEDIETREEPRIYEASPATLVDIARHAPDSARAIIMVGHNPGFEDVAALLVGHGDRYAYARMGEKFPTAAVAVIDFPVDSWREIEERGGRLDRFVTPRTLAGTEY